MLDQWLETPVGPLRAAWSAKGLLLTCTFTTRTCATPPGDTLCSADRPAGESPSLNAAQPVADSLLHERQQRLATTVEAYFLHGELQWDLDWLEWATISPFYQRVLRACYEIPAGQTKTYGELAKQLGHPRAARAVGTAMARNRWPILIPCHRVVGVAGKLVGYSGAGGVITKRWLLDLESHSHTAEFSLGSC